MADQTVVRLPNREWAVCAVQDLTAAGCRAELLPEPDALGHWLVLVRGSREQIDAIRQVVEFARPPSRFSWETFVNDLSGADL